jgi:hypothetical protein
MPSSTPTLSRELIRSGTEEESHREQGHVVPRVSAKEAVLDTPFSVAVMTAVCAVVTLTAVAANDAVVAAAAMVRLAGTVTLALLLVKATVAPPLGAAPLKVTVQELLAAPDNDDGLQASVLKVTGPSKEIVVLAVVPLAVAVRVAVVLAEIFPAVAVK